MINIKLSSHKWESNKKTDYAKSFVFDGYTPEMREKVKSFDTQDPNISVWADDENFFLSFQKREYFQTTQEAITRLQQIAVIEARFATFLDSL